MHDLSRSAKNNFYCASQKKEQSQETFLFCIYFKKFIHKSIKTIIKPIRHYGTEPRGCASKSTTSTIQGSQFMLLRLITNAPWYVTNKTLYDDLNIPQVQDVIRERSKKHRIHPSALVQPLLESLQDQRLKRKLSADPTKN